MNRSIPEPVRRARLRRRGAASAAIALAFGSLGVAACGDDDDGPVDGEVTTTISDTPTTGSDQGGSEGLDNNGQDSPDMGTDDLDADDTDGMDGADTDGLGD